METTGFQPQIVISTGKYMTSQYRETTGGCYNPLPPGWSRSAIPVDF